MPRKEKMKTQALARFLVYILGRSPHEFGLLPDSEGYVSFKELLQSLHEEEGWRHVRRGAVNEILVGEERDLFECKEDRIRTKERRWRLQLDQPVRNPPKLLYVGIRQRAHPHALDQGLDSAPGRFLVLCSDKDMALRIGMRRDPAPVLLEVATGTAREAGAVFYLFGGSLYLSSHVPAEAIAGPPLPKEFFKKKQIQKEEKPERAGPRFDAGAFVLKPERDPALHRRATGKKKGWKEEARKERRRRRREAD